MPRWNMIVDGGGTPPALKAYTRKPGEFEKNLKDIAGRFECKVLTFWWNEYSWDAYVTFEGDDQEQVDAFLREVEAYGVTPIVTTEEKERHPGVGSSSSDSSYPQS